jgi:NAD(P)-dependent dehydrogenase (short-subunit alcohol dehydrogenase family)
MAVGIDQAINAPKVLLTGASSQIGVFAIQRLLRAGFSVLAVSRTGAPKGFPVFDRLKWLNEAEASPVSQSCQYLLSTGPMALAQKFLRTDHQIQSAVVFSSSSVETKLASGSPAERSEVRGLLAAESGLRSSAEEQGVISIG